MIKNNTNAPIAAPFYKDLLSEIKSRVRHAQNRAVMFANAEMIRMYWDIGHMVAKRQGLEGWGKGLLRRLAVDLKDEIPEIKGFSERNLQLMIQFQREYPDLFAITQRPVAELSETSLPGKIRPQPVAKFVSNDSEQSAQGSGETQIVQQAVAQLPDSTAGRRSRAGKDALKGQQAVADIHALVRTLSWTVNILLIQKVKGLKIRKWYMHACIEQGWGRSGSHMNR